MAIEESELEVRQLTVELLADAGEIHLDAAMALDFDADAFAAMDDVVGFWEALTNAADVLEIDVPDSLQRKTESVLDSLRYALESQDVELIGRMLRDDLLELVEEWKAEMVKSNVHFEHLIPPESAGNGVAEHGLDE